MWHFSVSVQYILLLLKSSAELIHIGRQKTVFSNTTMNLIG